jgi:hypothetical protein
VLPLRKPWQAFSFVGWRWEACRGLRLLLLCGCLLLSLLLLLLSDLQGRRMHSNPWDASQGWVLIIYYRLKIV